MCVTAWEGVAGGGEFGVTVGHHGSVANPRAIDAESVLKEIVQDSRAEEVCEHEITPAFVDAQIDENHHQDGEVADDEIRDTHEERRQNIIGRLSKSL